MQSIYSGPMQEVAVCLLAAQGRRVYEPALNTAGWNKHYLIDKRQSRRYLMAFHQGLACGPRAGGPVHIPAKNPGGRWVRATETMKAKTTIAPSQLATQITRLLPCFSAMLPSTT